ncbi:MAG TPA: ABC transporter permease [Mycobacteriales bacterium]|nr:ABC transporter permease [Mycobacteriales bacterium]HWA66445.1 ABC transporter permease [Mycobacteriales bacterium]
MAKFLLRRFVNYLVLVFVATSIAYLLAAVSLHPASNYTARAHPPSPAVITEKLNELNSNPDVPLLDRYGHWLDGVIHGNLGLEVQGGTVNSDVGRRLWVSGQLLLIGTVLGGVIGIAIGAIAAVKQYKWPDRLFSGMSFVILALPTFVIAPTLELIAVRINDASGHQVIQYTGQYDPTITGGWAQIGNRLNHLILPTITLVLIVAAAISLYQRSAMLDVMGSDYVRTARAKGLSRRRALTTHALRTALIPAITIFTYNVALIFTGATVVEIIFGWHGMGELLITAIQSNDINATAAVTLFVAALVLLASTLQDFIIALLDPRVRAS